MGALPWLTYMYSKCVSTEDASKALNKMPWCDDVTIWSALILGHAESVQGFGKISIKQIQYESMEPVSFTIVGCLMHVLVEGHLNAACTIYKLAVSQISSWVTALWTCRPFIWEHRGCLENVQDNEHKFLRIPYFVDFWATEDRHKVLELYAWRQEGEGKKKNCKQMLSLNFFELWNACASLAACDDGRYVHQQIIQSGHIMPLWISDLVDKVCQRQEHRQCLLTAH